MVPIIQRLTKEENMILEKDTLDFLIFLPSSHSWLVAVFKARDIHEYRGNRKQKGANKECPELRL